MKTIGILVLWFTFIITLAIFVSCGTTHHCDAYGQAKSTEIKSVSK
jgi:hypothetical protein